MKTATKLVNWSFFSGRDSSCCDCLRLLLFGNHFVGVSLTYFFGLMWMICMGLQCGVDPSPFLLNNIVHYSTVIVHNQSLSLNDTQPGWSTPSCCSIRIISLSTQHLLSVLTREREREREICLSANRSISQSICLSIGLSIYLSFYLSIVHSIYMFYVYLSVYQLSVCLFFYWSTFLHF